MMGLSQVPLIFFFCLSNYPSALLDGPWLECSPCGKPSFLALFRRTLTAELHRAGTIISRGNGFESSPEGDGLDNILYVAQRPSKWFPPGYPLVIAAGSTVSGARVEIVAPWISRIALLAFPLAVFLTFHL